MRKVKTYILFLCLLPVVGYSQAERFMINSGYVVLAKGVAARPTYLVIHNGATSAITRTAGGIISEAEYNMVWWDIGTNTGAYTLPFQYSTSNYIPLTFNISVAGTGSNNVKFSTYSYHGNTANCNGGTAIADNACYMPSDVTNMFAMKPIISYPGAASTDDSYYVVDRFWIIDANSYTVLKPNPVITFSYINAGGVSEIAAPNVFAENTLIAQRFNSTGGVNTWGDWQGASGTDAGAGTASTGAAAIGTTNFYRSWTLASSIDPLPIQLTAFTANCQDNAAILQWTTATETNNDHFTIDRTVDGINFKVIALVKGSGNTTTQHNYTAYDESPLSGISYYRISQTDFDGNTTIKDMIPFDGCGANPNTINAFSTNGVINININSIGTDNYTVTLYTVLGQSVLTENRTIAAGNNNIKLYPSLSDGVYILNIKSEKTNYNKKLFIGK